MAMKAVQQIMLGSVCRTEHEAADTLDRIHALGYEGIELNGFMIRKTSPIVRLLTRAAGMPVGKGGSYDWAKLIRDSGLAVTAVHEDLGMIEREPETVLREADSFGTDKIVVTGMYRFDMSSQKAVADLAGRLNRSGRILSKSGVQLLVPAAYTSWVSRIRCRYRCGKIRFVPLAGWDTIWENRYRL